MKKIITTIYHSDTCNLSDLEELFSGKPHLEVMLKGRRWSRVKAKLKKEGRPKRLRVDREKVGQTVNLTP
jgi:hypothetical protein